MNSRYAYKLTRTKSIIQLMVVILVWSSSYAITKKVVQEIPPVTFAFLRFTIASLILIAFGIKRKVPDNFIKTNLFSILLMGLSGITLYYLLFNFSLVYTTASSGALIQGFIPVSVAILAFFILKENMTSVQIAGIILSVTGVGIMTFNAESASSSILPVLGNLLMLGSVFSWAVYTIISKRTSHLDSMLLTTYTTVAGTLFLIPAFVLELLQKPFPVISLTGWLSIIYLGSIASALSYYWYNNSLKYLSATAVGSFLNLDPVIGAIIAIVFLGEPILYFQIAGVILVLSGVWLNTSKEKTIHQIS